jgi:hypothetical protein
MDNDVADLFVQEITRFPDVQETRGDMFGERSFRVGGREFLHIHEPSIVHMLLSKEAKAEAIARGLAHQHPYAPRSGMVELRLQKEDEPAAALELAKQSYDYIRNRAHTAALPQAADGRHRGHV